jgi:hypothetical protein
MESSHAPVPHRAGGSLRLGDQFPQVGRERPGCLRDAAAGSQVLVDAEPQTAGGGQPGQRRVRGGKGPGRVQRRANAQLVRRADERDNRLVRLWLTDAGRALRLPAERERRLLSRRSPPRSPAKSARIWSAR